jgi:outer membrane protein
MASLAAAGLMAIGVPEAAHAQNVAYLDSRRVISEAPGAQEVREQIDQEMRNYEAQVQVLQDSINKMVTDYQQKSVTMSPDARQAREAEIVQARNRLQQQAAQIEQQATQKQGELMQPVMDRVEAVIEEVRKEGGYAIIFDLASAAMVSADTTLDLTTQVIERLKAGASPQTARR